VRTLTWFTTQRAQAPVCLISAASLFVSGASGPCRRPTLGPEHKVLVLLVPLINFCGEPIGIALMRRCLSTLLAFAADPRLLPAALNG
jgi:hypothetical protein